MCLIQPDEEDEKNQRVMAVPRRDDLGAKKQSTGKNGKRRIQWLSETGYLDQSAPLVVARALKVGSHTVCGAILSFRRLIQPKGKFSH